VKVKEGFIYASDSNPEWMSDSDLKTWIDVNQGKIGQI